MFAFNAKLRASLLCLLLIVFSACEYAPAPTSTPLPTATYTASPVPTATREVTATPTPVATATTEGGASTEATSASTSTGAALTGHVTVSSTRIRNTPSIRGKMVGQLKRDDPVIILGVTDDHGYLLIESADGSITGWTAKQSIALDDPLADIPFATPAA